MSISWEEEDENNKNNNFETQQFSANPILNDKIKIAVIGLQNSSKIISRSFQLSVIKSW
jgi:hypothetical protein